jgi:5'-methylthioadenosine phosphorylase
VSAGRLGVICGSGVAPSDVLPDARALDDDGEQVVVAAGHVVLIRRHGEGIPAHRVDHEANLGRLRDLDVDRVVALASTGSLRSDWPVGTVVAPDDFFAPWVTPSIHDDTRGHSIPGFDRAWRAQVVRSWHEHATGELIDGGVYVHTTGPRFETPAEIRFYATVGDLVGMTVAAECVLATEMGLAYASVCMVDNLANGLGDDQLTIEEFERGVKANRARFAADVRAVAIALAEV